MTFLIRRPTEQAGRRIERAILHRSYIIVTRVTGDGSVYSRVLHDFVVH